MSFRFQNPNGYALDLSEDLSMELTKDILEYAVNVSGDQYIHLG